MAQAAPTGSTAAEVDKPASSRRASARPACVDVDRPQLPENGDKAELIDYAGTVDGDGQFAGGTAEHHDAGASAPAHFIPGFEEQLVGA